MQNGITRSKNLRVSAATMLVSWVMCALAENRGQTGRFRVLIAGIAYPVSDAGYPFSVTLDSLIYGVWGAQRTCIPSEHRQRTRLRIPRNLENVPSGPCFRPLFSNCLCLAVPIASTSRSASCTREYPYVSVSEVNRPLKCSRAVSASSTHSSGVRLVGNRFQPWPPE